MNELFTACEQLAACALRYATESNEERFAAQVDAVLRFHALQTGVDLQQMQSVLQTLAGDAVLQATALTALHPCKHTQDLNAVTLLCECRNADACTVQCNVLSVDESIASLLIIICMIAVVFVLR